MFSASGYVNRVPCRRRAGRCVGPGWRGTRTRTGTCHPRRSPGTRRGLCGGREAFTEPAGEPFLAVPPHQPCPELGRPQKQKQGRPGARGETPASGAAFPEARPACHVAGCQSGRYLRSPSQPQRAGACGPSVSCSHAACWDRGAWPVCWVQAPAWGGGGQFSRTPASAGGRPPRAASLSPKGLCLAVVVTQSERPRPISCARRGAPVLWDTRWAPSRAWCLVPGARCPCGRASQESGLSPSFLHGKEHLQAVPEAPLRPPRASLSG